MVAPSSSMSGLRFLRPYLCKELHVSHRTTYIRLFNTSCVQYEKSRTRKRQPMYGSEETIGSRGDVVNRIEHLKKEDGLRWPRIGSSSNAMSCADFHQKYHELKHGKTLSDTFVVVRGKLMGIRVAGKALAFLDIVQEGVKVQIVCNLSRLDAFSGLASKQFDNFLHIVQRGDIISCYGNPYATKSGEMSIHASELPIVLSPSLASLPRTLQDRETRARNRHVDMLVNSAVGSTLRLRSHIIQYIRDFLLQDKFLEVQTPLIADKASGAIARPFTTVATEFSDKELALRIAPEIWLKRLIIGGMDRVFEIGPAFRNEGLDATHNPEFTTCEFYKSFTDLDELMVMTEKMLSGIAGKVTELREGPLKEIPELEIDMSTPFQRIEFIPAIERALGERLPDLAAEDAPQNILELFEKHTIPPPASPTLPRLLDRLASLYIEPDCTKPTFIIHHPACMAPLSKSFICPTSNQEVSARAELFIQKREIANMYEEENSPFEQRDKFLQQDRYRDEENQGGVDEGYIQALEWALPPTGGWGAGIDRIVMLFSGATRISDVLAFGSLRNVVNLGSGVQREKVTQKEDEDTSNEAEREVHM